MTRRSEGETTSGSPSHQDRGTSTHRRNALPGNAPRRDEKLLKKMANTRARQPDETLVACVEEARKDALEVAQEADAPPQARAEDASTLTHWRVLPPGGKAEPPIRTLRGVCGQC